MLLICTTYKCIVNDQQLIGRILNLNEPFFEVAATLDVQNNLSRQHFYIFGHLFAQYVLPSNNLFLPSWSK